MCIRDRRIEIEDGRLANDVTSLLMGSDVPPRKEFIYEDKRGDETEHIEYHEPCLLYTSIFELIDVVIENNSMRVATGVLNEIVTEAVAMQQPPTDLSLIHIYEQRAAEQLINMGYSVLACNYRNRFGEIDIIAKDGDTICFCEVKYRRDNGRCV